MNQKVMNYQGLLINPFELKKQDFDNFGMQSAVTLSRLQRFWGQLKKPYSVAQHCLSMVAYFDGDKELQKWAIAHEAFEALTGMDIPSPYKNKLPEFKIAENKALALLAEIYNLTYPVPEIIKIIDKGLMVMEAEALMPSNSNYNWQSLYGEPKDQLYKLNASEAEIKDDYISFWSELFCENNKSKIRKIREPKVVTTEEQLSLFAN